MDCFVKQHENDPLPDSYNDAISQFNKFLDSWTEPPTNRKLTGQEKNNLRAKFLKQLRAQQAIINTAMTGGSITLPIICQEPSCVQDVDGSGVDCSNSTCSITVQLSATLNNPKDKLSIRMIDILQSLCSGVPLPIMVKFPQLNKEIGKWIDKNPNDIPVIDGPGVGADANTNSKHTVTIIGYECDDSNIYLICQDSYYDSLGGGIRTFKLKYAKRDITKTTLVSTGIPILDGDGQKRKIIKLEVVNTTPSNVSNICNGPTPSCDKDACDADEEGCSGTCLWRWDYTFGAGWDWIEINNSCAFSSPPGYMGPPGLLCQCSPPLEPGSDGDQRITQCNASS